jgi:hypothetical protein
MFDYSVEFSLHVDRSWKYSPYSSCDVLLVSEHQFLWDMLCFDADFYYDHPEFDKLVDGDYWVYAHGTAEFESDINWEYGVEEGHYLLGIDKLRIVPAGDKDD